MQNGKTWKGECCKKSKKGKLIWTDCIIFPIKDIEGKIFEYWNITTDITEKKRVETQISEFAYLAAHDLQEPLRVISSYLKLLDDKYKQVLDKKAQKYISHTISSSNRMKGLIDNLLAFSLNERDESEFLETDMNLVVKTALEDMNTTILESSAIIQVNKLPIINVSESQIRQLFQNIISNGIKFTPQNKVPKIHISYKINDHSHKFYIKDNGIGIKQKMIPEIFTIFKRLNSRGDFDGSGIGLAICKKIVERHNGKISVESKLDEGTIFCISLPK